MFTSSGGTIIGYAHVNKAKNDDGNSIHAGTTDIIDDGDCVSRKAVELALEGDTAALRLCLERIVPPIKEHALSGLELPEINEPSDALEAIAEVGRRLATGDFLPSQAAALCNVFEHYRKHFEMTELEERIRQLEDSINA